MKLEVTPERIRLGGQHLDALMRGTASPSGPDAAELDDMAVAVLDQAWSELVEAGVVTADGPAPDFADFLAPMIQPWAMVAAEAAGPSGSEGHWLWLTGRSGLTAADLGNGWCDLLLVAPQAAPHALVQLLLLGARQDLLTGSCPIPSTIWDVAGAALEGGSSAALAEAFAGWPAVASNVAAGDWRLVHVRSLWAPGLFPQGADEEEAMRQFIVLDTPSGYVSLTPNSAGEAFGLSATDVWQLLIEVTLPPEVLVTAADVEPIGGPSRG